jgi:hypothetical protein
VPDEFVLGIWQRQQTVALGGGEDRTAGHAVPFLKTLVCDKPAKAAARRNQGIAILKNSS